MTRGLQLLRESNTGTIDELAGRIGIDRTYCGRLLSGDREPSKRLMGTLRDVLGIPIDAWYQDLPQPEEDPEAPKQSTGS